MLISLAFTSDMLEPHKIYMTSSLKRLSIQMDVNLDTDALKRNSKAAKLIPHKELIETGSPNRKSASSVRSQTSISLVSTSEITTALTEIVSSRREVVDSLAESLLALAPEISVLINQEIMAPNRPSADTCWLSHLFHGVEYVCETYPMLRNELFGIVMCVDPHPLDGGAAFKKLSLDPHWKCLA